MEKKMLVKDSDNELIVKLSMELVGQGVLAGADCYYVDEDYSLPFFKIPKAYKKESEGDPDVHFIFIDVDDNPPYLEKEEYTVYGNFLHEHIPNAKRAAELVKGLLSEEICELALVYKDRKASCFMKNTKDHQKNVEAFLEHFETVSAHLQRAVANGHLHTAFAATYPNTLFCQLKEQQKIADCNVYAVSAVFGFHPEFYVLG